MWFFFPCSISHVRYSSTTSSNSITDKYAFYDQSFSVCELKYTRSLSLSLSLSPLPPSSIVLCSQHFWIIQVSTLHVDILQFLLTITRSVLHSCHNWNVSTAYTYATILCANFFSLQMLVYLWMMLILWRVSWWLCSITYRSKLWLNKANYGVISCHTCTCTLIIHEFIFIYAC